MTLPQEATTDPKGSVKAHIELKGSVKAHIDLKGSVKAHIELKGSVKAAGTELINCWVLAVQCGNSKSDSATAGW